MKYKMVPYGHGGDMVRVCMGCGALVVHQPIHDQFHADNAAAHNNSIAAMDRLELEEVK